MSIVPLLAPAPKGRDVSFLLDPPLLAATGAAIESFVEDEATADRLAGATLALFLGVSVPLWLDSKAKPLELLHKPFGSDGARDFMVNSGVLRLPTPKQPGPREHLLAGLAFATYPAALHLGRRWGRRRRARRDRHAVETARAGASGLS